MGMNLLAALVYVAVLASVITLIVRLSNSRSGSGGALYDVPEAAFLRGGPARVVDSVLATMHADGLIGIGGPGIVVPLGPGPRHPVEQAVLAELAAAPHGALHTLRLAVMRHPSVQEIGNQLAARGLLVTPAARRGVVRWAMIQGFGSFAMIFVSVFITVGSFYTGEPVPFVLKVLPALGFGIVSALICGAIAAGRVTGAGQRALLSYRRQFPYRTDAGFLVALRGLGALPDPELQAQLITAARMPRTSADSGSGSTDLVAVWCAGISGGGGGCGGGGGGNDGASGCSSGSNCSSSSSSCSSSSSSSSCSSSSSSSSSCGSSS
ncbi:TIGR04222 domain-containing membrane protein [Streptomyces sp. NPDC048604]|uniref:TIGR04222 domain-containing membrane protein n=1 Tax=Streptomyces sp. NPDC048604 TaxID=3365578 RepID=UPI00371D716B